MTIKEIYELADKIGLMVFSTIYNNEVHSRIAHFNGFDEQGLYFRTMPIKQGETQYECIPEHCDDCGSCMRACPVNAIKLSTPI